MSLSLFSCFNGSFQCTKTKMINGAIRRERTTQRIWKTSAARQIEKKVALNKRNYHQPAFFGRPFTKYPSHYLYTPFFFNDLKLNNFYHFKRTSSATKNTLLSNDISYDDVLLNVTIMGPPNAGKSTLFNRLLCKEANKSYILSSDKFGGGKYKRIKGRNTSRLTQSATLSLKTRKRRSSGMAIVSSVPGTTRDRRECIGRIGDVNFRLIDTAGIDVTRIQYFNKHFNHKKREKKQKKSIDNIYANSQEGELEYHMIRQSISATQTADLILLMFDGRSGMTSDFVTTARWLQKHASSSKAKVLILANKLEGDKWALPSSVDDYVGDSDSTNIDNSWIIMEHIEDASRMGFGDPVLISALHGDGLAEVATIIQQLHSSKLSHLKEFTQKNLTLPENNTLEGKPLKKRSMQFSQITNENPLQIAILGRQNVGKSTLVNALMNEERVITGSTPGLTRDSITIDWLWNNKYPIKLSDTAGIRKFTQRGNTSSNLFQSHSNQVAPGQEDQSMQNMDEEISEREIEDLAVLDAVRAMKTADVGVLVIDGSQRQLTKQDLAIADAVVQEGRCLIIAANKMDLIGISAAENNHDSFIQYENTHDEELEEYTSEEFANDVRTHVETRLPMLRKTPVVAMSSLYNENVSDLIPLCFEARERWQQKISTGVLNRWLSEVLIERQPPRDSRTGKQIRIKYCIQTKGRPPTFMLFANVDKIEDLGYLRYLQKHFQDSFHMFGMEVRFAIKSSSTQNPFDREKNQKSKSLGIGGRAARQKRMVQSLKKHGLPFKKGRKGARYQRNQRMKTKANKA